MGSTNLVMQTEPITENVDGLIRKVREEGVAKAQAEGQAITEKAQAEARQILEQARGEAEEMIEEARARLYAEERAAQSSLRRAARDVKIALWGDLERLFESVVRGECVKTLESGRLAGVIAAVARAWIENEEERDLEVLLGAEHHEEISNGLLARLREELQSGVTLRVWPGARHGFLIGRDGVDMKYEFTEQAISEALCRFLNPRLTKILQSGEEEEELCRT